MFGDLFSGPHLLIVLAIVVLLFGATRLPALARALGQSRNAFKSEIDKGKAESAAAASDAKPDETTNTTPKP
jgi:sec-independent protein translocase protein TatA